MAWTKNRLKLMRISSIAIITTFVLLLLFAGFTFYGNKVGNFIINVNDQGAKLSLSQLEDLSDATSRLTVAGVESQTNATLSHIPSDISLGLGDKSKKETVTTEDGKTEVSRFMAFSFYLLNYTEFDVNYTMTLKVFDLVGDPLSCLRVMVIEGDSPIEQGIIYAQPEATEEKQQLLEQRQKYTTRDFSSDTVLIDEEVRDFRTYTKVKYTFVFWVEGWDESCVNERINDRLKMELEFTGY